MTVIEPIDVQLGRLSKALLDTGTAYEAAKREESQARSRETAALNDMNKAQREFDAFVAKMKENAPPGSDWKSAHRI